MSIVHCLITFSSGSEFPIHRAEKHVPDFLSFIFSFPIYYNLQCFFSFCWLLHCSLHFQVQSSQSIEQKTTFLSFELHPVAESNVLLGIKDKTSSSGTSGCNCPVGQDKVKSNLICQGQIEK